MANSMNRLQDTYFKKLDATIEKMNDNFSAILADAQVSTLFCMYIDHIAD